MSYSITEKIDAITLLRPEQMTVTPPAPKSIKISLSDRCNYRCGFCALRMRKEQPKKDIDFELFKRVMRECREAGVVEVGVFFLGESFMAPDLLVQAIWYCKRKLGFPYVFLTTNGSLAHPEIVYDCMNAGLDSLKFSINAADLEQFAAVMAVKPELYLDALDNLKAAREVRDRNGFKCGIYASSIMYDGEQGEKMEKLLNERVRPYCDETYFLPLYSMGSVATQREEELGYKPTAGNQGRLGALREPLPCWSVTAEAHLTSRGILSACCFDADERWNMADLNEVSFMEGWHSEKFQKLRAAHLKKDVTGTVCEECVAYR